MSKVKSKGAKDASKSSTDILTKVKDAAVTKPAQTIKAKSKDLAKQVVGKEEKKSKKVKEPTPESSEAESESSESSESDDESDEETKPVLSGKTNGIAKKAVDTDDESDDSASSESSADEAPTNGVNGKAPAVTAAKEVSSEDDSDDESDEEMKPAANAADSSEEDSDDDSDEETVVEKTTKSKGPAKANKLTPVANKRKADASSDEESDEEAGSSDDEEDSGDSDAEVQTKPAQQVKRKGDETAAPAAKKTKTAEAVDEGQGNNLFVGNLSWNVDEEWLKSEFENFGELAGIRVITDRDTGRSKGFGYVEFVNAADAAKAHAEMKDAELDNRKINVDFAASRGSGGAGQQDRAQNRAKTYGDKQSPPTDTLFVGNLAFEVGQDAVSQAFGDHGTILGIRLPTDRETGQPKGFGYVQFASVDEAQGALEAMQGYELEGRAVRLDYSQPRPQNGDSPARGRGGFGGRGRGGFGDRGGRGGRGGFGDRGGRGGGRGRGGFSDRGGRGGRGGSTNRGGFGDFSGKKITF